MGKRAGARADRLRSRGAKQERRNVRLLKRRRARNTAYRDLEAMGLVDLDGKGRIVRVYGEPTP